MLPDNANDDALQRLTARAIEESMIATLAMRGAHYPRSTDMPAEEMQPLLFAQVMHVYDTDEAFRSWAGLLLKLMQAAPDHAFEAAVGATAAALGAIGAWDLPGDSVMDYCETLYRQLEQEVLR